MRNQTDGTTTPGMLAILASSVGIVENSDTGKAAWLALYAQDPKQARAEVFKRVAARRAAASAKANAAAGTGKASAGQYPPGWLAAAGVGGRRSKGARVTEAGDR